MRGSDKSYWHRYLDFYEQHLPKTISGVAVEFGVLYGDSIRWLADRYPDAEIVGVDILPIRPEWPQGPRIRYYQRDQGDEAQIEGFFDEVGSPQLIIEDGSHMPSHQSRCLRLGVDRLAPGGVYILEDLHTSHPKHPYYADEFSRSPGPRQTSLSVLLGLEHLKRCRPPAYEAELRALAGGTHFSYEDVSRLDRQIESIHVYRRPVLPDACFSCGGTSFDYHDFKCKCGVPLLGDPDSMSVALIKSRP